MVGQTTKLRDVMADYIEDTDTGIYRVTRDGRVFSKSRLKIPLVSKGMEFTGQFKVILRPERELSYAINNRGYRTVCLRRTTFMVHRLVAQAYIPNPENKPFVNHIDGDKLNNQLDNLEWVTAAENNAHARTTGLHNQAVGHRINYQSEASKRKALANLKDKSKLTPDDVRYVRKVHVPRSADYSATALAAQFGTSVAAMSKILRGVSYPDIV